MKTVLNLPTAKAWGGNHIHNLVTSLVIIGAVGCAPMRVPVQDPVPTKPLPIESKQPEAAIAPALSAKETVLIGIRVNVSEAVISSPADILALNLKNNDKGVWPAESYRITVNAGQLWIDGKPIGTKWRFRSSNRNVFLKLGTRAYRGDLTVRVAEDDKLNVINELSIDDYLKGVLPREASASWPEESLRVQAVASRSYLASHLGAHSANGFDLCSEVHCQVYGGLTNEHPKTNAAVDSTRDEILVHGGKPISAYFFSHCGGLTEGVQYVWGTAAMPYLGKKKCDFCKGNPRYNWSYSVSASEMLATLVKKTNKVKGSELRLVKVRQKSPSGRAQFVSVRTDVGTYDLSGNAFRIAMHPEKIRSTLWTNLQRKGNTYTFSGRGWGHGVGMCQWGAKGQSDAGRDYREILQFYYPNTKLTTWSR
jgi:stage II sporulation protein D